MSTYSEQLAQAQTTVTITPVPLILEKQGEKFRGMYIGLSQFDKVDAKTGEMVSMTTAHFFDGEKILFNMGAQLVRAISKLTPGVSIELELKELKANKHGGKTKIYSVTPLNIPVANLAEMFGGVLQVTAPAPEHLLPAPAAPEPNSATMTHEEADAWIASKDLEKTRAAVWGE